MAFGRGYTEYLSTAAIRANCSSSMPPLVSRTAYTSSRFVYFFLCTYCRFAILISASFPCNNNNKKNMTPHLHDGEKETSFTSPRRCCSLGTDNCLESPPPPLSRSYTRTQVLCGQIDKSDTNCLNTKAMNKKKRKEIIGNEGDFFWPWRGK